jgi:hypothetical protein
MTIWTYIKAEQFFPEYCPDIKNYKRKISGNNGRGNPVEFTREEKKQIRRALREMVRELSKYPDL